MAKDLVGVQIGSISFIDEGVEEPLDILQEKGAVNALMIAALTWAPSVFGRAKGGSADHGITEPLDLVGGAFWDPDPKYYDSTFLKEFRAPDPIFEGFDTLRDVIPAAKKRGMKVYPYLFETVRSDRPVNVPNFAQVVEVDAHGRLAPWPCFYNPAFKAWMFSVIEDLCQSYDIDGILWGVERQGPLTNLVGYGPSGEVPTCFCAHCREEGYRRGIDVERAREGYIKIAKHFNSVEAGEKPRDGYFVSFLRILLNYTEVLQWEKLWLDGQKALCREIYGLVKFLDPEKEVGLGLWQWITTYNPYLRAQWDYSELRGICDWVKPVLYNVPAGVRFREWFVDRFQATVLKDATVEECINGLYKILNLDEAPPEELSARGFSPEYVRRETARLAQALDGEAKVYPGIGIGLPSPGKPIEPEDVKAAIRAAYQGGADGVLLCRMYVELMFRNLEAAGEVLRELGKA